MWVLVVDDELSVCTFLAEFLRKQGFKVAEASSGARALAIARELGPTIYAVVSDMDMPEMSGVEMWKQMRALLPPGCKVLFMSGDGRKFLHDEVTLPGELLHKPFSLDLLKEKLCTPAWNG